MEKCCKTCQWWDSDSMVEVCCNGGAEHCAGYSHSGAYPVNQMRFRCSVCGMNARNKFWDAPYCPNCGAKMDGGKDNA